MADVSQNFYKKLLNCHCNLSSLKLLKQTKIFEDFWEVNEQKNIFLFCLYCGKNKEEIDAVKIGW